ncbi:MAG: phosphoglycerate dehydrogenase [Acidobacteria bacterium]|nr:MAG: phosphoglycerate dehydrogenase [Acidobacteriota bacterium]
MMASVAVASRSFSKHPLLRAELTARYPDAAFNELGRALAGEDLIAFLRGHDRAIIALERIDARILDALPALRVISKYGVGLDMLDLVAMNARSVRLGWSGGVNKRSVAELTIAAAIQLLHRAAEASADVRAGQWRQWSGRQLTGKSFGIIGCGHVGKDVAVLARAFDCSVLACDLLDFPEFYSAHGVRPVDLDTLLRTADVVTLHVPLDASTHRLINRDRLNLMKRGSVVLNFARGGIIDEAALVEALRSGAIAGAAVDVLEHEPPIDRALIDLPNVLATPHIGGSTEEAVIAMGRAAIAGLEAARLPSELGLT